ncbi:uncharacterized protein T551_02639 [Pneumocystis jirovecii RU7]|uniref:Pre-mRNA-splicing factor CWC2 n=2 Tax=Pneumocystis jirovecii TaxID=42068 RepID=A0A0W4ZIL8_PNEJ7|nr:uncharacterized protein T551_02639 [Pneumocystis jirovecii RU7]KTW28220.1 hypothetical protein T551_02639 [Pneumocystis jirovecii RU7]
MDQLSTIEDIDNASLNLEQEKVGVEKKRKRRPARRQVEGREKTGELMPPQTGQVFNIWYGKWAGGDKEDKYINKNKSETRCNIKRDSGYTKGDKIKGAYFCLFFARGSCSDGPDCTFLHRLPNVHDIYSPNVDCFGRDKHSDYRDDMGGVGSFMRQNHTLYCGRIHVTDDIEEIVARHFSEWGEVERIRVLNSRGVAFITYVNEANAQFAKEAMAHQSLENNEVLNVRWATQDPNPVSQARDAKRVEEQAAEAIRRALPKNFIAELEGRGKKIKRDDFGLDGYDVPDDIWYARCASAVNPAIKTLQNSTKTEKNEPSFDPLTIQEVFDTEANEIFSSTTLDTLRSLDNVYTVQSFDSNVDNSSRLVAYASDEDL